jgi:DNA repair protein RadC
MGDAKAVSVQAALELGKRRRAAELPQWQAISSSQSVFELMQPVIGELPHEEFWILYLNNAHKIMLKAQLSKGGITGTLVDVRLVYKTALELGSVGIILAHNHPSGTLRPSESDKQITKKLKMAGEQLDIRVLDHLIITEHSYFSFADEGML